MIGARTSGVFLVVAALTLGCQPTVPKEALQLSPQSLEFRQMQTRKFETKDEAALLSASAALLQDLGFNIDESESKLGVIVGSKDRDARETGQIVGAVILTILIGAPVAYDEKQRIRASVVTRPISDNGTESEVAVRVTFQRIIWNNQKVATTIESLNDPKMYQEFFDKLSKSVFLEAQEVG